MPHFNSYNLLKEEGVKLPNSVTVFDDGRVAVADGENCRICVFSPDGGLVWQHDKQGFADDGLREPITVAVTPDQYLLAADWHNNRLLVFTPELEFSHALFHPGPVRGGYKTGPLFTLEIFAKHLLTRSVGAPYYFSFDKMEGGQNKTAEYSIRNLFKGLGHYGLRPLKLWRTLTDRGHSVRKIDGVIVQNNQMILTQKANRCVSVYDLKEKGYQNPALNRHIFESGGTKLGRVCNLASDGQGRIYICDQENWRITALNPDYSHYRDYMYKEKEHIPQAPFACCVIDDRYLAAVRSFGIEIRDLETEQVVFECDDLGETHGLAWDSKRRSLYYVDRSHSNITLFDIPEEL